MAGATTSMFLSLLLNKPLILKIVNGCQLCQLLRIQVFWDECRWVCGLGCSGGL